MGTSTPITAPARQYVALWAIKRAFIAVDEWLFYVVLIYLYRQRFPRVVIALVALYGSLATFTHYKNLEVVERLMGVRGWLLYPLASGASTVAATPAVVTAAPPALLRLPLD